MTTTKQSWLKRSLALLLAMMMVMSLGIANVSAEDAEALPPAKIPTEPLNKEAYQEDYYYAVLEVPAYLYNADVEDTYSMGNDALSHTAYIMLSPDGELTAKVQFHEMAYNGGIGHLTKMYYYENKEDYDDWIHGKDNNRHDVSVESFYDGIYPSQISFPLSSPDPVVWLCTVVDAMGYAETGVRLGFDFTKARKLEGKELAAFYVEQFSNQTSEIIYTDDYEKIYERNLFDAKMLLTKESSTDDDFYWINAHFSSSYDSRTYYERKSNLKNVASNYAKQDQGDFTDESWKALQSKIEEILAFIDTEYCTDQDVYDLSKELDEIITTMTRTNNAQPYSKLYQDLYEQFQALNQDEYTSEVYRNAESCFISSKMSSIYKKDEIKCREYYLQAKNVLDNMQKLRVVIEEDGKYEVGLQFYDKTEDGNFVKTDKLDAYTGAENGRLEGASLEIYYQLPKLFIDVNQNAQNPLADNWFRISNTLGDVTSMSDLTEEVQTEDGGTATITKRFYVDYPEQSDKESVKFSYYIYDKNGNYVGSDEAYVQVDYENAKRVGELDVDKSELNQLIELMDQDLSDVDYTDEWFAALEEALAQAKKVKRNPNATIYEVDAAYDALNALYQSSPDSTYSAMCESTMDEIADILCSKAQRALYDADKIAALEAVYNDVYASGEYNKENYTKLKEALDGLNPSDEVNKSVLLETINQAKAALDRDLTDASRTKLENAIAEAEGVYNNPEASQDAVNAQIAVLNQVLDSLEDAKPTVDKQALKDIIDEAKAIEKDNYTDTTYNTLQKAIEEAETVYNNPAASEQDVADQITALANAMDALEEKSDEPLDKDNLEDGIYSLYVDMYKTNRGQKSMSDNAINHTVKLEVKDGKYYIELDFKGLAINNQFGYLRDLSYYADGYTYAENGLPQGERIPSEVLTTQKNADGTDVIDQYNDKNNLYPDLVRFELVPTAIADTDGFVPLHVFVPIMEAIAEGNGDQDVLMKIDWSSLKTASEEDFEPEKPTEPSPAVDYTDDATGVKVHADKGVFAQGVQIVVLEITKGADYDSTVASLSDVGKKFKLYDVKFFDAKGKEIAPNGTVSIRFPITAGYDSANVAVYRMADANKILVKGMVENGYYTVNTKSAGNYALVEKGSAITDAENSGAAGNGNQNSITSPQTGSASNMGAIALLALAAAGMMGVTLVTRKRRSKEA